MMKNALNSVREALKAGNREEAMLIADDMFICSAAEQGGGYSGLKVLEHKRYARLIRIEAYLAEPERSSLKFFESEADALAYATASPIRFTPYSVDGLSGGTS